MTTTLLVFFSKIDSILALSTKALLTTWHDHLNYPSFNVIKKNLPTLGIDKASIFNASIFCVDCQVSKVNKLTFLSTYEKIHTPFELVYTDLWISARLSRDDEKYFLSIVGVNTRIIVSIHFKQMVIVSSYQLLMSYKNKV